MPDPDASRGSLKIVGGSGNVGDEALRQRLIAYLAQHPHLTTKIIERKDHSGVSRTALDLYIKGSYFLAGGPNGSPVNPKNSKIEDKIRDYLNRVEGTETNGYSDSFTPTVLSSQLEYACNTAIQENILVLAYGSPGHGKSRSIRQYMNDRTTTRPISILCSKNITLGYFVRRLARELGIPERGSIPDLEDQIADKLIKNKRVIFVDQANYLNENALGTICHIWERAHVGIVLIGTYNLYTLFSQLRDQEDIRGQLASRVALMVPLMGLSLQEAKIVIEKTLGGYATEDVVAEIFKAVSRTVIVDGEKARVGNFRNLSFLLPRLMRLIDRRTDELDAGDVTVLDLVITASNRLMITE